MRFSLELVFSENGFEGMAEWTWKLSEDDLLGAVLKCSGTTKISGTRLAQ